MPYSARLFVAVLIAFGPAASLTRAIASPAVALLAQTPTFELPETVPTGTDLSIQSSPNLGTTAQALQEQFQAAYDGTVVTVDVTSSDDAVAALVDGDVDLAAIGRPLTDREGDQDLTTVPLEREKIAVIIGPENPFNGNLTFEQFAAMFRGEITDWSEVGGEPGPIRFVDRPERSDRDLEKVGRGGFERRLDRRHEDEQALGNDGISYAIAPHVLDQEGVKIVSMHQTLPDDPRYPYSQPRYFVFKDTATPAVAAFLGFATSAAGAEALVAARQAEAGAVASGLGAAPPVEPEPEVVDEPAAAEGVEEPEEPAAVDPATTPEENIVVEDEPVAAVPATDDRGGAGWLWWLLPIAGLGALAWALTRGKGSGQAPVQSGAPAAVPPVAPEPPAPAGPPVAIDDVTPEPVPPAATNGFTPVVEPPPVVEPEPPARATNDQGPVPPATPAPPKIPDVAPPPMAGSTISAAAGAAGLAAGAAASLAGTEDQAAIEASKYNVVGRPMDGDIDLSGLDDGLPPLPDGYGDSRIVLMPRDPQWAYAYWDTPSVHKEALRNQGGERLALRLYDVTDVDLSHQSPHSMQQFDCDELAREWYLQLPISDRDYRVEIGYLAGDGRWLVLATSNTVRIPPVYPSDWTEEHFVTVGWETNLKGTTIITLADPKRLTTADTPLHDQMFALSQGHEFQRVEGSIFGSMQHVPGSMVPQQAISSYVFPSGVGMGLAPGAPGFPGFNMSGLNVSGLTMSGVGFSASAPPIRPRKFWLVADAELIVYGATEPDATVTVGGNPIQLSPEGTFRFQTSFQDGQIEYPIMGVAADGEQNRSIHLTFERQTPERRTNTKEDAQEEWPEGQG